MADAGNTPGKKRRNLTLIIVATCLVAVPIVLRTFLYEPFKIPSGAMMPTIRKGDHILANQLTYAFGEIGRGDIIVFRYPLDESEDFIKRVVGLPGDEVTVGRAGLFLRRTDDAEAIRIEQIPLDEPCLDDDGAREVEGCTLIEEVIGNRRYVVRYMTGSEAAGGDKTFTVPEGHLFVLGDNRNQSHDSAQWTVRDSDGDEVPEPFVPFDNVKGRATRIWLPFSRWGPVK